jgi:hypothetical protein
MPAPTQMERFVTAIAADDDAQAEALVSKLTGADEPDLLALLQSTDSDQRWWAVRGLAHCGTPAAVPALVPLLGDADPSLRAVVAFALGHLHARAAAAVCAVLDRLAACLADEDGGVRQAAADGLALCGDDAVPALAHVLYHGPEAARTRAVYALRKIASPKTAPLLYQHLNDPNYLVRTYAYEALDEMGLLENMLVSL